MQNLWVIDQCFHGHPKPHRFAITRLPQKECVLIGYKTSRELKNRFKRFCKERGANMSYILQRGIVDLADGKIMLKEKDNEEVQRLLEGETFIDRFFTTPFIRSKLDRVLEGRPKHDQHRIINSLIVSALRNMK